MNLSELRQLLASGESERLEFKRSTGQRTEAAKCVCAMLNGAGGHVVFGVTDGGEIVGQQINAKTLEDLANEFCRIEPQVEPTIETIDVGEKQSVIVLSVPGSQGLFLYDGRPYVRSGPTTQRMTKTQYEQRLLFQMRSRERWENQPIDQGTIDDLDHEEILRTREAAIQQRRISAGTSTDIGDILDRLGLRRDGKLTQAALVLYGKNLARDYIQCHIKMGRFRGTGITGDILDNRQEYLNAFAMMREGMAFLDRTLPLASHFPEGKLLREDRLPIPPAALREVLLNAIIHRDYSAYYGYVAIAVFDDRVEIRSIGSLMPGITVEMLSGPHLSLLRNPLIADAFHRVGAIEAWGRGTNRVIEECRNYGLEPPTFREESGGLIVTFKAPIGPETRPPQERFKRSTSSVQAQYESLAEKIVELLRGGPLSLTEISHRLGQKKVSGHLKNVAQKLVSEGRIVPTVPDKPRSPLQRYRLAD